MKMETKNEMKLLDLLLKIYNAKKRRQYRNENARMTDSPVVFFGDSITDKCDFNKFFPGVNALNRGISGNTVSDLINRIEVSVCNANPSKIILLIGINDMMNVKRSARETAKRCDKLLRMMREKCPAVPILCQSVYPGYDAEKNKKNKGLVFPLRHLASEIVELNLYIQDFCRKYGCIYIDVHSHLKEEDNTMVPSYSDDGCHPNEAGYQVMSKVITEYL